MTFAFATRCKKATAGNVSWIERDGDEIVRLLPVVWNETENMLNDLEVIWGS